MQRFFYRMDSYFIAKIQNQVHLKQTLFHSEQFILFLSDCVILNIRTEVRIAETDCDRKED